MKSIENIHEITKAMEMIAAFRFKRAEGRFAKSRIYLKEMETLVANLSSSVENIKDSPRSVTNLRHNAPADPSQTSSSGQIRHAVWQTPGSVAGPLFEKRIIRKKTLLAITGDKGLCGAYNTNLLKAAASWVSANADFETAIIPVGKVACESFKKKHIPMLLSYPERSKVNLEFAKKITWALKDLFLSAQSDSIELLYTTYRPGAAGKNIFVPFLSLDYLMVRNKKGNKIANSTIEYILEPDFETVFISLLSRYLEGKVYLTLLESLVSEYSARMIAMKQATDNSDEILDHLRLLRNKTRQATITRELSEIVSGASVLV
ncbi:MAG: ATP synthase F1 subunit gamma [Candidatus Omnitrophica bacterium CG1_02_49_16]|nr:MAG: ATP synthase F1 subunit gamma [Candidatus Omnitrophica bacterium CG1_02_49_16]